MARSLNSQRARLAGTLRSSFNASGEVRVLALGVAARVASASAAPRGAGRTLITRWIRCTGSAIAAVNASALLGMASCDATPLPRSQLGITLFCTPPAAAVGKKLSAGASGIAAITLSPLTVAPSLPTTRSQGGNSAPLPGSPLVGCSAVDVGVAFAAAGAVASAMALFVAADDSSASSTSCGRAVSASASPSLTSGWNGAGGASEASAAASSGVTIWGCSSAPSAGEDTGGPGGGALDSTSALGVL